MLRLCTQYHSVIFRTFSKTSYSLNSSKAVSDLLFNLPTYTPLEERRKNKADGNKPRYNDQKPHRRDPSRNKKLIFKWSSGTPKQQAAVNSVLAQIFEINPRGLVKALNSETNRLEQMNVRRFLDGIDLDTTGIAMVNVEKTDNHNEKIPVVKFVPIRKALKSYSEALAKIKEQELLGMGVNANRVGRRSAENKVDSAWKSIKVSWQISDYDLKKQKYSELTSNLQKGQKLMIYINDKDVNDLSPIDEDELSSMEGKTLSKKEMRRREEVLEKVNEIVSEYSTQITSQGSPSKRMILKVSPNRISTKDEIDKKALKEQRKRERQEKLQKRIERKNGKHT